MSNLIETNRWKLGLLEWLTARAGRGYGQKKLAIIKDVIRQLRGRTPDTVVTTGNNFYIIAADDTGDDPQDKIVGVVWMGAYALTGSARLEFDSDPAQDLTMEYQKPADWTLGADGRY